MSLKSLTDIHSFNILERRSTKGALGGKTYSTTTHQSGTKGRFQQFSTTHHAQLFQERHANMDYVLYTIKDPNIDKEKMAQYEIAAVTPASIAGSTFRIIALSNPDELSRFWRFGLVFAEVENV